MARAPEGGWLIAAVGLTGKILGPIGLADLLIRGAWPRSTVVLCVTNDLIWWLPFGLYLNDAWPFARAAGVGDPVMRYPHLEPHATGRAGDGATT